MDGFQLVLIVTLGAGIGVLIAGPFFGCKVPPVQAFAAGAISGLCYLIPTVGAVASLAALIYFVGIWGTGDWMDAAYTALVARLATVPVMLLFGFAVY